MIIAQTHFVVYNVPTWTEWAILNVEKYFMTNNLDLYFKVVLHNSKTLITSSQALATKNQLCHRISFWRQHTYE